MIYRISLLWCLLASPIAALECQDLDFDGKRFSHCVVDIANDKLRLFLRDGNGKPYQNFSALPGNVRFAMNAGMYHGDRSPVGHYVENGMQEMRLLTGASSGNFGLLPNGVLCIRNNRVDVLETLTFKDLNLDCVHASQSGPMLVINGTLHPRFIEGSEFTNIRNGVGTSDDGQTAHFVISNQRVTFHHLARLFRDFLGVNNALYFDGRVSRLYAPELGRADFGAAMGPIVAVIE